MSVRVFIADDQALVRAGFRKLLESEPGFEVVGEAADGLETIEAVRLRTTDVVLMDIRMPRLDGIEATRRVLDGPRAPRVLILTTFDADDYVFAALRAGASGFLLKDAPPDDLIAAIRVVAAGDALLSPSVTRKLIEEFASTPDPRAQDPPPGLADLTARELEVLGLVGRGLSNSEIADELVIGEATVKTHVGSIPMKIGARDRTQAAVAAYETGLVRPGSV